MGVCVATTTQRMGGMEATCRETKKNHGSALDVTT